MNGENKSENEALDDLGSKETAKKGDKVESRVCEERVSNDPESKGSEEKEKTCGTGEEDEQLKEKGPKLRQRKVRKNVDKSFSSPMRSSTPMPKRSAKTPKGRAKTLKVD